MTDLMSAGGGSENLMPRPSGDKPKFSAGKKFALAAILGIIVIAGLGLLAVQKIRQERLQKYEAAKNLKAPEQTITIIEGWTTADIANYLEKQGIIKSADFLSEQRKFSASDYELLTTKPEGQSLEGFLFPDTYRIPKTAPALAGIIIKKMLGNFASKFTQQMQADAAKNGLNVYQTMILASIIEKETGRNAVSAQDQAKLLAERKMVAGIFYNRLNIGQALESDATVNYITKKNLPSASAQDIAINSPYNTYKYKGLPPGPICNPSLSSILAAIYPTQNEYFYFLHKQPSGEIVYAKTFQEHLQNKAKYLQ